MAIPHPPKESGPRARRLWKDILTRWTLDEPELLVLEEACACLDRLDALAPAAKDIGAAMTESRLQQAMLEKLLSRLGAFDQDDNGRHDNQAQRRGERRGA